MDDRVYSPCCLSNPVLSFLPSFLPLICNIVMSSSSHTPLSSPSRSTSRAPLSSVSNPGRSSPDGSSDRTSLGKRRRSPPWNPTQTFSTDSDNEVLAGVLRSWWEAKESCKMILEYSRARDEEEEEAYMLFLEEREAMAREMLAKVACAKLKWGAIVDGRTLEGAFIRVYAHI